MHPDEGTIHAWLDGALTPAEAREFEDHVAGCAECAAAVAAARGLLAASSRILSALDNVPAGVVPGSDATFAERLARSSRDAGAPGRFRATRWRAAAALVLVAGTSWLVLHPRPQSASDGSVSERQAVAAAVDTHAILPAPQVDAVVPQSITPASPSEQRRAPGSAATATRANVRPKDIAAARADSLAGTTVLGSGAGAQSRIAQAVTPSTSAYESRSAAAQSATAGAMPPARDAAAGNAAMAESRVRREQSLARETVAAMSDRAQEIDVDRAAIDSVLAADSARNIPGHAMPYAELGSSAAKMRGATSAPSAVAPSAGAESRMLAKSSTVDGAAGCYVLETTGWVPEDKTDQGTASLLPARIELQRAIGLSGDERGNRLARPAPGEPGLSPGVIGFWRSLDRDRIRVTFADDTSWVALTLVVAPDRGRGPARAYSASSGRLRSTEVEARRVLCQ